MGCGVKGGANAHLVFQCDQSGVVIAKDLMLCVVVVYACGVFDQFDDLEDFVVDFVLDSACARKMQVDPQGQDFNS